MSRWAEAAAAIRLPADEAHGWRVSGERFDVDVSALAAMTTDDGTATETLRRAATLLQQAYTTLGSAPGFAQYFRSTMIELRGHAARLGLAPVAVPWEPTR